MDRLRVALVRDVVHQFGEATVRVTGSSMLPSIWPGDVLTIRRRLASEIRAGEIAVFTRHGRLFAHRVVAHLGHQLVTQGDRVPSRDTPVTEGELLGVVVSVSRGGRSGRAPAGPGVAGRLVAALVRRCSRAGRVVLRLRRSSPAASRTEERRVLG